MRISDWSSDVCSSDLEAGAEGHAQDVGELQRRRGPTLATDLSQREDGHRDRRVGQAHPEPGDRPHADRGGAGQRAEGAEHADDPDGQAGEAERAPPAGPTAGDETPPRPPTVLPTGPTGCTGAPGDT